MKTASIVITLIDPDFNFSLPARWGTDYQIDAIDIVYLNGETALCLHLSPLQNPNINTFVQGCQKINCSTDYPYFYLSCSQNSIPPAIGSAWGTLWRVSECRTVLKESYMPTEGYCLVWHWRLTLSKRREPIKFLPTA